ncbi:hypothetical protein L7F22_066873 [Adiantum nelumboides]|nr:hypothetical protein [Adiantum nelumboides]
MASSGDGKERVIATAQHILKSLSTNDNTDDMLRILFKFDDRFSGLNGNHHKVLEKEATKLPVAEQGKLVESLDKAGLTVLKWERTSSELSSKTQIWSCHTDESESYLHAVDELQDLMGSLSLSKSEREAFDRAQSLLQVAMSRLEEEFKHLLLTHSSSVDPEWILEIVAVQSLSGEESPGLVCKEELDGAGPCITNVCDDGAFVDDEDDDLSLGPPLHSVNFTIELLPSDVISDLNDIARRMIAGGYGRECSQIYSGIRKAFLEQSLLRLGVEKLSIEDVHKMAWELLEVRIKKWVHTLKVAVRVLYASERILCEQVFTGLTLWRESAFADLARSSMLQILSLGEAIAISRRSPEKLFKILDMYETLWDLIPDINLIFSDDVCCNVRAEAHGILVRLGEAARGTFAEFENAIQRDASKIPVPGGAVHPLTRYVMNYIWLLFSYSGTLRRLLGDKKMAMVCHSGTSSINDEGSRNGTDHLSPLAVQIIWLTVLLECNLDGKSKLYRDIAQSYLFLMNNAHYIVQKVKQSELSSLVGEDWVRKHAGMVRQYATNYVRAAWMRALACLRDEGIVVSGSFSSGISKVALKERYKTFNSCFEELLCTQSAWIVPDPQLREELRLSIAEKLIPAYRSFSSRYQSYLDSGRHPGKYVKYTAEDLESCLLNLFEGTSSPTVAKRRSFSVG